jgi:hypothetical protein
MANGLELTDPHLSAGGGLEEMATGNIKRANMGLEMGAYSESEREQYNARVRSQNKMGVQELAGAVGSAAGMAVGGPIGAAIGGMAAGMIAGQIN